MTKLRQRSLTAFSDALRALYAEDTYETLSTRVLTCLRSLFDGDFTSFSVIDLQSGKLHTTSFSPSEIPNWPGMAAHQRFLAHDPVAAHIMRTREVRALKMSDFVSLRQYRDLPVYTEVFGKVGCDRRLGLAVQNPGSFAISATINRAGMDFTEEERTTLDLLRPHLLQARAKALAHQNLQSKKAQERADLGEAFGIGLGEVDAEGKLLWLTPRAEALLSEFFPGKHGGIVASGRVPEALAVRLLPVLRLRAKLSPEDAMGLRRSSWWFAGPAGRKLNVRLVVGGTAQRWQLLFEVTGNSARSLALTHASTLTNRQREVLHWVKLSKTNREISIILQTSERTIEKHVEHLLAKLHMETRANIIRLFAEADRGKRGH